MLAIWSQPFGFGSELMQYGDNGVSPGVKHQ
jgi:hypothetical protein